MREGPWVLTGLKDTSLSLISGATISCVCSVLWSLY